MKMYKIFYSRSNKRYLYDSISNNFFEVDDDCFSLLNGLEGNTQELQCLGKEFWEGVYGSGSLPKLTEMPIVTEPIEIPEILVLELTQQCNFRCEYCVYSGHYEYERKHQNTKMSKDTIDRIVEKYFETEKTPDYVSLYGGEPLLQFELIQYLVQRIEETGSEPEYAITTNGSMVLNEQIARFLVDKKVRLTISYDGLNHDMYRKTINQEHTSEMVFKALELIKSIDESYFKEYISLSITLAPPYQLAENAKYFNSHKLLSQLKLLVNTVNEQDSNFFDEFDIGKEKQKLSDDYSALAEEFICMDGFGEPFHRGLFADAMLRIEDRVMSLQTKAYPPGPCNPGKNRLFITATGNKYMCERVGNYGCLGSINDNEKSIGLYHKVISDFKNCITPYCKECLYVRICDACYSIFRESDHMGNTDRIQSICNEKRKWFDFMMYVFLSKKERGNME